MATILYCSTITHVVSIPQEGHEFFEYYNYYQGRDSAGSNGYNTYVSAERAMELGIVNITMEKDILDLTSNTAGRRRRRRRTTTSNVTLDDEEILVEREHDMMEDAAHILLKDEPFIYMSSASTADGPRESIRLEGKRHFNRGLFIIDLRHMPAGCGVWPAFWLTDEANWPVNGEIDIVEGVNYQSTAKTALHATTGCSMDDVPHGVMTGGWDTAVGIPDSKTGIPDTTLRYAMDCFVYNTKQWLNQGCVAVDMEGGSLGMPLNRKGGGVYALEWDPVNRHMRTWVFTPHVKVPKNLQEAISTASQPNVNDRVMPDPELWPLPYGYFPIGTTEKCQHSAVSFRTMELSRLSLLFSPTGDETSCPSKHFKDMRLVFNLAFCGSVAGNRYQLDCPVQSKSYQTCNDWIATDPEELKEAYWKIRGVYVYEREWERAWL